MGLFTDAATGNPQNDTQQQQFFNAFTSVSSWSLAPYGGSTKTPMASTYAASNGTTDQNLWQGYEVGDAAYRITLYKQGSTGYGALATGNGTAFQASMAATSTGWLSFGNLTVPGATLDSGVTFAAGYTNSGSLNLSGTLTVGGTLLAAAAGIASGSRWASPSTGNFSVTDDGVSGGTLRLLPDSNSTGLRLFGVTGGGASNYGFESKAGIDASISNSGSFSLGTTITDFKNGQFVMNVSGGNSTAAISHGCGGTPQYLVMGLGDGGAFNGTTFYGFSRLGGSTFTGWASGGFQTFGNFIAIRQ